MKLIKDRPDTVPIFPLPGALLLPRARLPLNIFEPRYQAMLEAVLKTDARLIGMIQPTSTDPDSLQSIGCAGRVTSFSETEDGRYMITLTGVSRFRLADVIEGFAPYKTARADWSGFALDLSRRDIDQDFDRPAFLDTLARYFDTAGLSCDWDSLRESDEELLINSLSMLCPFSPGEKQVLLESPSLAARRETLTTLMEFALRESTESTLQ